MCIVWLVGWFAWSFGPFFDQSVGQWVVRMFVRSVGPSVYRLVARWISCSVGFRGVGRLICPSVGCSVCLLFRSFSRSVSRFLDQVVG